MKHTNKLTKTTVILHWTVALFMIALCSIGFYMVQTETYSLYHTHKSLGLLAFIVITIRLVWRYKKGWIEAQEPSKKGERIIAKNVHILLLALTLSIPVTGMMYSGGSGYGFGIFNLTLLPENHNPKEEGEVIPYSQALSDIGQTAHEYLGYALVFFVVLHLLGVLKHVFIYKNRTLKRMLRM